MRSEGRTYCGVAFPLASAAAPEGDMVKPQVRLDPSRTSSLTNHHASGMINQDTLAKLGSRVDVNMQHLRYPAL